MSLKDTINHFFGNVPNQDKLQDHIDDLARRLEKAHKGVFSSPFYKETPFDINSERGKIYIETLEVELLKAQETYDRHFPPEPQENVRQRADAECGIPLEELSK